VIYLTTFTPQATYSVRKCFKQNYKNKVIIITPVFDIISENRFFCHLLTANANGVSRMEIM
jgi:hypothetical protein